MHVANMQCNGRVLLILATCSTSTCPIQALPQHAGVRCTTASSNPTSSSFFLFPVAKKIVSGVVCAGAAIAAMDLVTTDAARIDRNEGELTQDASIARSSVWVTLSWLHAYICSTCDRVLVR